MPAKVVKRGNRWRVVEENGQCVKNASGTCVDGNGHRTQSAANRQAAAINRSKNES